MYTHPDSSYQHMKNHTVTTQQSSSVFHDSTNLLTLSIAPVSLIPTRDTRCFKFEAEQK